MCMHRLLSGAALTVLLAAQCLGQGPELGQVTPATDIAAWDISISSDGVGLPPGGGTAKQGEVIYAAKWRAKNPGERLLMSAPNPSKVYGRSQRVTSCT